MPVRRVVTMRLEGRRIIHPISHYLSNYQRKEVQAWSASKSGMNSSNMHSSRRTRASSTVKREGFGDASMNHRSINAAGLSSPALRKGSEPWLLPTTGSTIINMLREYPPGRFST